MTVRVTEALSCMANVMRMRYKEGGLPAIQLPPEALTVLATSIEDDLGAHLYVTPYAGFQFDGIEFVLVSLEDMARPVPEFWKWRPENV